jgi:hypothetical protein
VFIDSKGSKVQLQVRNILLRKQQLDIGSITLKGKAINRYLFNYFWPMGILRTIRTHKSTFY